MIEHIIYIPTEEEAENEAVGISSIITTNKIAVKVATNQDPNTKPVIEILLIESLNSQPKSYDIACEYHNGIISNAKVLDENGSPSTEVPGRITHVCLSDDTIARIELVIKSILT